MALAKNVLRILSVTLLIGCAADVDEDVAESESALGNAPNGSIEVYNMNTHHLSEPGKPSFEVTDWRQMISYMKEQAYLPDFILLSEVGRHNSIPSQPCNVFVRRLEKVLSPKGKIQWECEVAKGSPNALDNAGGGTAIVYRRSMQPLERKTLVNFVYQDGKCVPDPTGPGLTFIQTFKDGKHTVAVASLHLVSPSAGATNQYDRDCSAKNLKEITDAMDRIEADAKIIGGDMNHADAKRHLEGGTVVHDNWEAGYAQTVSFLAKGHSPNAGFKDAWFKDCANTCGVDASPDTTYSSAQTQCISACIASTTSVGRIDWLLAKGARSLRNNVSIPFAEARAAYIRQTGDTNAVEKYSDHLAQRMTVVY